VGKPPLWKFSLYLVHVNKEKGMIPQTNIKVEQERFVMRHLVVDISVSLNPWWHTLDYIELRQTCDSHLSPCATSYNHIKPTFQRRKYIYGVMFSFTWGFFCFEYKGQRKKGSLALLVHWGLASPLEKQVTLALINVKSLDSHRRQGVTSSNKVKTWVVVIRSVCYFFSQGLTQSLPFNPFLNQYTNFENP
jgi:hypothetical protein